MRNEWNSYVIEINMKMINDVPRVYVEPQFQTKGN